MKHVKYGNLGGGGGRGCLCVLDALEAFNCIKYENGPVTKYSYIIDITS